MNVAVELNNFYVSVRERKEFIIHKAVDLDTLLIKAKLSV